MTFYAGSPGSCRPGDVPHIRFDSHVVGLPVRPGHVIGRGDIVTPSAPGEPVGAARAASIGDGAAARNWGDVSRGAFMALQGAGGPRGAGGDEWVRAMPASGEITTLLDAGVTVGSLVGVDLRIDAGTGRADRDSAVGSGYSPPGESNAGQLWQRSRLMTREQAGDPALRGALLGRVKRILPARAGGPSRESRHGDCGIVSRV